MSYDVSKCRFKDCTNDRLLFNRYCHVHVKVAEEGSSTPLSGEDSGSQRTSSVTPGEPTNIEEGLVLLCEQLVWQTMGQHTTLTDPRNRGIVHEFGERYAERVQKYLAQTQNSLIDELKTTMRNYRYPLRQKN